MSRSLWLALLAIATLVVAGVVARRDATGTASPAAIAELDAALRRERAAREELRAELASARAEIASLRDVIDELRERAVAASERGGAGRAHGEATRDVAASAAGTSSPAPASPATPAPLASPHAAASRGFDEAALLAGGMRPEEARRMRELAESVDMDQLYLRDRATREGWAATPRFAEESRAIGARVDALREEVGDDAFDWFLFASNRLNRVLISDVLERSPASAAGLQPGDVVLRYADRRVFDASELARATTEGRAGETVSIEVARGNERRVVHLPRGPLGVRLGADRARPGSSASER